MVDRISKLPDELLCHILSFLPTQQAVATSILSKRWLPLWISVPVLDFDNQAHPIGDIEMLVYATLQARDPQQPITSFRLIYDVYDPQRANADVNVWVNTVIQRGIENIEIEPEIELELDPESEPEFDPEPTKIQRVGPNICLSSKIFSCRTLVVLKLKRVSLAASSSVELPALKSLNLNRVNFEEPQYLMELLYGCPILEDLKTFVIRYAHDGSFCEDRVKILPKLVRAEIRIVRIETMDGNDANVLLKAISNVEFLTITQFELNDAVPEFPHLRHLGLSLEFHSCHSVILMLKNCPKLQSFIFGGTFKNVPPYPHFVPECLTSCLTKCYLRYYPGYFRHTYLQFAKYILQNSTHLQVMKIGDTSPSPPEVLEELALCPRKSASCELSFI
ncbi:F-box/FBD/LRR-repeat protein At1g16930-like [Lotus japonicus]|uniref:F-box/FBD/LRR-repeat protein At1g16930-like n=1 Tax=Lotus japonicus TaxID=34305 RepID=UPI002587A3F6|nr:F-box/FBD/LRR-repeat protein At1g16930-like [Lotus japonicus]